MESVGLLAPMPGMLGTLGMMLEPGCCSRDGHCAESRLTLSVATSKPSAWLHEEQAFGRGFAGPASLQPDAQATGAHGGGWSAAGSPGCTAGAGVAFSWSSWQPCPQPQCSGWWVRAVEPPGLVGPQPAPRNLQDWVFWKGSGEEAFGGCGSPGRGAELWTLRVAAQG